MNSGEPRKSLYILKPMLAKQPLNPKVMEIAASNYFKMGEFQKCIEFIDNLFLIDPGFSLHAYLLKARANIKEGIKFSDCVAEVRSDLITVGQG